MMGTANAMKARSDAAYSTPAAAITPHSTTSTGMAWRNSWISGTKTSVPQSRCGDHVADDVNALRQ